MEYEYWGYITRHDDGSWAQRRLDKTRNHIDPSKLPEEFKTKIAMLDFMEDYDVLPCGSHKACYNEPKSVDYYLYIEVSSTREE